MKPERLSIVLVMLALSMIILLGAAASAEETAVQPQLPHTFYGTVEVAGSPATAGIAIEATGVGVRSNISGNPVNTLPDSTYGKANFTSQTLVVQGNIAPGTPLNFYVGGIRAEVYDVAAGGPWKETYPYEAGGYTELNLRVASQPAAGQTRVPTPTQTVLSSSTAADSSSSSTGSSSSARGSQSTTTSGGAVLPQVPDSPGEQPTSGGTQQAPSGNTQQGTTGHGEITQGVNPQETGTAPGNPVTLPATGSMTMYAIGGILLVLIIAGGLYYIMKQGKNGAEEKKPDDGKEQEEKK